MGVPNVIMVLMYRVEISLIGFDDVLVSRYVRPRLTTVRYPP